jgi:hypothetical protein
MKPIVIEQVRNPSESALLLRRLLLAKNCLRSMADTYSGIQMGEVWPFCALSREKLEEAVPDILQAIAWHGFPYRKNTACFTDITMAKGNINHHTDSGFGKLALMLLRVQPMTRSPLVSLHGDYEQENLLWARNDFCALKPGDIAIFDSEQEHAWFCNGVATFLTIPVVRQRKRRSPSLSPSNGH